MMTRNTPLSQVFAGYTDDQLPRAFREQFFATPEQDYDVVLEGVMHKIWHRPRWLKPLFVLFGWLGILVPKTGEGVPTKLAVVPGRLPNGKPYHEWNRSFAFDPPIAFNTRVVFDDRQNNLADQVGPGRFLHLVWEGKFVPPRSFTLKTVTNAVQIGERCVYLPHWVWALLVGPRQIYSDGA